MFTEPETLRTRLLQLRQSGHSLAELLTMDADRLDADGWPPSRVLSDDLRRFRDQVSSLTSLLNTDCPEHGSLPFQSLHEIDSVLANRERAIQALVVARTIIQISPSDGAIPVGLVELQSTAREMIASQGMHVPREEILSFTEGLHAWCDLLRMIRDSGTLPDAEWTALNTSIESSLGRALAVAAARGRLQLPPNLQGGAFPQPLAEETQPHPCDSVTGPLTEASSITSATHVVATEIPIVHLPNEPLSSSQQAVSESELDEGSNAIVSVESRSSVAFAESIPEVTSTAVTPVNEALATAANKDIESAWESPVVAAQASAPLAEPSHSVFDDIEPIPLAGKFTAPLPAHEVFVPSSRPQQSLPPKASSSSSIFDDDADDEDELIMDRSDDRISTVRAASSSNIVLADPSPLAERLLNQARFSNATGPAAILATAILNGPETDRVDLLPDLILHLIHEGRPGLAYHLSRCLEAKSLTARPFVPSWLIRTWTYGHALVFHKGQLAGLLQDDLQSRSMVAMRDTNFDWNMALSLLVRAATLRPAIIAPGTRAAAVLRDFELRDGCVQLYNFCSRIGAYGERIQGIFPGLFKQSSASVPYSDQLSQLRADIARWQESNDSLPMKSVIATQLFQKTGWSLRAGTSQRHPEAANDWMNWQIALRMGESLVTPVIEDRRTDLSRVKADVEEISTKLSADDADERRRQISQPEIRAYLRQAITFAQRWIGLHSGAATAEAQSYLPQAAVELRSEIQNRFESVMEELQTLASDHQSFEIRMAVACLMLSVQEIHDLVDPNAPTDVREADPRHLLHSELLKIPDLSLNSSWEPEADFHALEEEILKFISQPQPDWTTAFKVQLAQGNLQMADRILSLAIWSNEERDALQGVLERDRHRKRTHFSRELSEVHKLLTESVHLDILKASERAGFETRLTKLQAIATSDTNVSSGFVELDRVREALVKRREREADRIRSRLRQLSHPPNDEPLAEPPSSSDTDATQPRGWVMDFNQ